MLQEEYAILTHVVMLYIAYTLLPYAFSNYARKLWAYTQIF